MKKIMMTLAAALVSVAASAQVYVGGTVGFQTSKANGDGVKAATKFSINPEIGYNISDNFAIGINLGYAAQKGEWETSGPLAGLSKGSEEGEKTLGAFTVAPYARYTYAKLGPVNLFLDGKFSFTTYNEKRGNRFGVNIIPGVAFNASENIAFVAKMGEGLGWNMFKASEGDGKVNKFGLDFDTLTALQFGLYFNF